ncbi:MAG: DUF2911 domain-containing protein [Chitinophagaceae bacterium]|nr:DUF2911 domain-containing protein [Chitinophagaceae bacterium]
MRYIMKVAALAFALLLMGSGAMAQLQITEPDKSPLDVSYHPHGYPILKIQGKSAPARPSARVLYSRPQKNGRTIFGDVVRYGEVWRMGANESTEVEFYRDVTVAGKTLAKGRYTLYAIPQAGKWVIIFNKGLDNWGAFNYQKELDAARVEVPVARADAPVEFFTIVFDANGNLVVLWDAVKVAIPIKYK